MRLTAAEYDARVRIATFASALLVLAAGTPRADLPDVAFTEAERARLAQGEAVVARREPADGKGVSAQASMILEGTPDEVWAVVDDCAHFKDFMPHTKSSEERLREPGHSICRVEVSLPFPMHDLWSETDIREVHVEGGARRRLMTLREGTYRKFHAAWDLIPQGTTRTLVVYRLEVDPQSSVPDALLRIGQESSLPDTMRAVQKRLLDKRAERAPK